MEFRLTFKNMHSSPALAAYAQDKLQEKIEKYVHSPIEAHVTFSVNGKDRMAHCQVFAHDRFNVQVEARGAYMLSCVDRLADKLDARLRRRKEKVKSHKVGNGSLLSLVEDPGAFATGPLAKIGVGAEADAEESIDAAEIVRYEKNRHSTPTFMMQ